MASSWYVEKRGRQLGPFTGPQLKELAATGRLEPGDLVRRADSSKTVPEGDVRGLFPVPDPGPVPCGPPPPPSVEADGPPPLPTSGGRRDGLGERWKGLTQASRAAAGLAAAQARKAQLVNLILPAAYLDLGRDIHAAGRFRDEFPELLAEIVEVEQRIGQLTSTRSKTSSATSLADRTKNAAMVAKQKTQAKALSLKKESLLRRLGASAIAKCGARSGPETLVQPIIDGLSKGESLDQEIVRLSKVGEGTWVTPKRLLVGSLGLIMLGAVVVARKPSTLDNTGGVGIVFARRSEGFADHDPVAEAEIHPATVNEPAASVKDAGTMMPDFSGVDYGYDFSEDDYQALPDGSTKHTRSGIIGQADLDQIDEGDPNLVGKWADEEGYRDAQGRFVRQGRRIVWFDDDRREKYCEALWLGGKRHGPMVRWRRGGEKAGEVTFVNGELHGPIRHWYEGGQASIQAAFLHGKQHGLRIEWYPNGQKELEVAYANDLRQGPMRAWYEDGKPKEESLLVDDRYEGLVKVWGSQSRQPDELHYRDGKLHGVVIRHTRDGRTTSRATYRDGVLVAPALDVSQISVSDFLRRMEEGSVMTRKSRRSLGSIWWEDAWFEMFGPPRQGVGTYKWTYSCLDGVVELVSRPVQEGEGQEGQIWVSVYNGSD